MQSGQNQCPGGASFVATHSTSNRWTQPSQEIELSANLLPRCLHVQDPWTVFALIFSFRVWNAVLVKNRFTKFIFFTVVSWSGIMERLFNWVSSILNFSSRTPVIDCSEIIHDNTRRYLSWTCQFIKCDHFSSWRIFIQRLMGLTFFNLLAHDTEASSRE